MGRPTVMSPSTIARLEDAYEMGCTDVEACLHAGIAKQTLYNYEKDHPEFIERKNDLKHHPTLMARQVVRNCLKDKDKAVSQWYLERKARNEFSTKTEIDQDINITVEITAYGGGKTKEIDHQGVDVIDVSPVDKVDVKPSTNDIK